MLWLSGPSPDAGQAGEQGGARHGKAHPIFYRIIFVSAGHRAGVFLIVMRLRKAQRSATESVDATTP